MIYDFTSIFSSSVITGRWLGDNKKFGMEPGLHSKGESRIEDRKSSRLALNLLSYHNSSRAIKNFRIHYACMGSVTSLLDKKFHVAVYDLSCYSGGGAMVLGELPVPGRPTI